jgi:hypothetical protein
MEAAIPDHTRSGLFLIKMSIIAQAAAVSPRKVRLAQMKGDVWEAAEFIFVNIASLVPVTITNK